MMRTKSIAILTALTLGIAFNLATAQEAADKVVKRTITFTKKAPTTGDFLGSSNKTSSDTTMSMSRNGESAEPRKMSTKSEIVREVTILQATDAKVVKAKVFYRKASQVRPSSNGGNRQRRGGRRGGEDATPRANLGDLEGKTFILDFSETTPKVLNEENEAHPESLAKLVLRRESKDGKFTGWGHDMTTLLGKTEVTVGEVITLDRKRVNMLVRASNSRRNSGRRSRRGNRGGGQEKPEAQAAPKETMKASLTLKGVKTILGTECAEFALEVTDNRSSANERRSSDSKSSWTGTVLIGINNSWLYKVQADGAQKSSMSMARNEMEIDMDTTGSSKVSKQVIYSKKKAKQ